MEVHDWHWVPNAKHSWVVESITVANIKKLGHSGGRGASETETLGQKRRWRWWQLLTCDAQCRLSSLPTSQSDPVCHLDHPAPCSPQPTQDIKIKCKNLNYNGCLQTGIGSNYAEHLPECGINAGASHQGRCYDTVDWI